MHAAAQVSSIYTVQDLSRDGGQVEWMGLSTSVNLIHITPKACLEAHLLGGSRFCPVDNKFYHQITSICLIMTIVYKNNEAKETLGIKQHRLPIM